MMEHLFQKKKVTSHLVTVGPDAANALRHLGAQSKLARKAGAKQTEPQRQHRRSTAIKRRFSRTVETVATFAKKLRRSSKGSS